MESTKFIVPITNFFIESAFKIGDVYYLPPLELILEDDYPYNNSINESEFEILKKCLVILEENFQHNWSNYAFAITSFENLEYNNVQESSVYVNRICEKVDRSMDYLRIQQCQIGNFDTLPGLAGIMNDGFKNVFKVDVETENYKMIPGEITLLLRNGIGLAPSSEPNASNFQDIDYQCIFSNRTDEVFLNCRAALTRINEAMYMANLNTAFVYLMTTLEMLANKDEFIQFSKVKPRILPFITRSKTEYHTSSTYLFNLSKNKREEIVHNGKNIFDLYQNSQQVKAELFKMTGIIVRYVRAVIETEIETFEELEIKRLELMKTLGV